MDLNRGGAAVGIYRCFCFVGKINREAGLWRFCCRGKVRVLSLTAMVTLVTFSNTIGFLRIPGVFSVQGVEHTLQMVDLQPV